MKNQINRQKFFQWILVIALVVRISAMYAQTTPSELSPKQQSIVSISALTATGNLEELSTQLETGLDAGLTVEEIKEMLVQLYAYCGFPRSLNAIQMLMKVLDRRKASGKQDMQGNATASNRNTMDRYECGRETLETLTKTPQSKPAPGFGEFAPRMDAFLKEHLFADIFDSDVLTYQQRELVTISALASMPGVESQLQSHLKMGINTGLTKKQLVEVSSVIGRLVSTSQANVLRKTLDVSTLPLIESDLMVRISEIEILPEYLQEYQAILKQEAAASVEKEAGVLSIFPMTMKDDSTQIRIVEIYANQAAYQSHLKTPHFLHYKTSTLKMVKSLKLMDMKSLDSSTMVEIYKKLN